MTFKHQETVKYCQALKKENHVGMNVMSYFRVYIIYKKKQLMSIEISNHQHNFHCFLEPHSIC